MSGGPTDLEQVDQDLERLLEATESVEWGKVPEIPVGDVAKWNQRLQYARKCVQAELEDDDRLQGEA